MNGTALRIVREPAASAADIDRLGAGIEAASTPVVGPSDRRDVTYFVRDPAGAILAGVHGNTTGGWLYVSALWVSEPLRGTGLGRTLMRVAEEEAVGRGCAHAYLDTFSHQAPGFYERIGYTVFAELESFPGPHRRIFLRKRLGDPASAQPAA